MGGDRHDRPSAVFHKNKVGQIDRNLLPRKGVLAIRAAKDTFFLNFFRPALGLAGLLDAINELLDGSFLAGSLTQRQCRRVLYRN